MLEVQQLEQRLQQAATEVQLKEEELVVWGERLQQIQHDNEAKLRLALSRADGARVRRPGARAGRGGTGQGRLGGQAMAVPRGPVACGGSPSLRGIAEGDEEGEEDSPVRSVRGDATVAEEDELEEDEENDGIGEGEDDE